MAAIVSSDQSTVEGLTALSLYDEALSGLDQDAFIAMAGYFGLLEMLASLTVSKAWRHQVIFVFNLGANGSSMLGRAYDFERIIPNYM